MSIRQKGFIPILILVLSVLAIAGYLGYKNYQTQATPTSSATALATADPTANWKTYTNEVLGFEFKHPLELDNQDRLPGPTTGQEVKFIQTLSEPQHKYEGDLKIFNGLSLYLVTNIQTVNFEKYVNNDKEALTKKYLPDTPLSVEMISGFKNIDAYKIDMSINWKLYYLHFPITDQVLVISWANLSYSTNPYWNTDSQILSTFQFTK